MEAWKGLLDASDGRRAQLVDTAEKFRFFSMARDLMAWMESIIQQIETQEKPRCALWSFHLKCFATKLCKKKKKSFLPDSTYFSPSFFCIRDVSSVELLQKYHQGIRSEIEAREAKFPTCIDLGKALLTRKHRDSVEVRLELQT